MGDVSDTNVQIVLNIKEGAGFGFLSSPFLVSASLNSQRLDTDPVSPCSNPVFDCELVWELDKKYLTNLRLHNMPIKVEVSTIGLRERRERVGYMVLSLPFRQASAPPRPAASSWHKLLGVTGHGKYVSPQVLLSLSIEDRKDIALMATEAALYNESARSVANPQISVFSASAGDVTPTTNFSGKKPFVYHESHLLDNMRPLPSDLVPRLCCDEGIIQIGPRDDCQTVFSLSFFIGCAENVDLLMPDKLTDLTGTLFHVNYRAFSHSIQTERFTLSSIKADDSSVMINIQFNQRTSLRLCSSLGSLTKYFACCPYITVKLFRDDQSLALCNIDLRKIVPTDNLNDFLENFCNKDKILTYSQKCYLVSCANGEVPCAANGRKPYIDIQVKLKYIPLNVDVSLNVADAPTPLIINDCQCNNEENFKLSISAGEKVDIPGFVSVPENNDSDVGDGRNRDILTKSISKPSAQAVAIDSTPMAPLSQDKRNDTKCTQVDMASFTKQDCAIATDDLQILLAPEKEQQLIKSVVEELEEWKEKQQKLFKTQLKCKEDRRLEMLSVEWNKKRSELEDILKKGVDQCKQLAIDLTVAKEELTIRGCDTKERQKKLSKAKQTLEVLYNNKYQDLRSASKHLEEDYQFKLKSLERRCAEQDEHIKLVEKENTDLKEKLNSIVSEMEKVKKTGLTKNQTADLLQELRALEEKLETAEQSKQFFKEQWSKAIHEIHVYKLQNRRQMQEQLHEDRQHIEKIGLEQMINNEQTFLKESQTDLKKLKDDLLGARSSTSSLGSHNGTSLDMDSSVENSVILEQRNDKFNYSKKVEINNQLMALIEERNQLLNTNDRDEVHLSNLTHKIRNLLIERPF